MHPKYFKVSNRRSVLEERRNLKRARSAHAYTRGNTVKFYEWLESGPGELLPEETPVWICGDCHVGNLGPVANTKGRVEIAIRDLDQRAQDQGLARHGAMPERIARPASPTG